MFVYVYIYIYIYIYIYMNIKKHTKSIKITNNSLLFRSFVKV